jgi:hypothetical protein
MSLVDFISIVHVFISIYRECFLIMLNGDIDIIRRCLDIDLVEGANVNQAQHRD